LTATIQVIVVLYQRSFEQSESLSSLFAILRERPEWAQRLSLLVYDNSPHAQVPSDKVPVPVTYIHDSGNSGLAKAYNAALARAEQEKCEWLLLLDQDTSLNAEFVSELLEVATRVQEQLSVGAIVPKLMVGGTMHSPAREFFVELRRIRKPGKSIYLQASGMQQQHLVAYNSGSALRVSALRAIGGFPAEFWLDFLDHAVFHKLYQHGYRLYILNARLAHDFSDSNVASVAAWRQLNVLEARNLYVKQNGSAIDRLLYRIWLLRRARSLRRSGADPQVWRSTAFAALWLARKHKR